MSTDTPSAIVIDLVERFHAREAVGLAKYGVTLDRKDLSPADLRQHLLEELMDACLYLVAEQRAIASQPAEQPRGGPVAWRSPDELPDVKANDCRFFQIAVRRKSGKVFSYPAVYCNSLALTVEYEPKESSGNRWSSHFLSEDLADEGELGFTGWWDVKSNCEYDTCYEPALEDDDELVAWCELPNWNADTAQPKPEQAVGDGVAMQRVIDAALALISDAEEVETADGLANVAQLHLWHALEDAVEKVGPADISNFTPRPAPVEVGDGVVTLAEAERVAQMAYIAGKRGYTFDGYVDELRTASTPRPAPVAVGDGVDQAEFKRGYDHAVQHMADIWMDPAVRELRVVAVDMRHYLTRIGETMNSAMREKWGDTIEQADKRVSSALAGLREAIATPRPAAATPAEVTDEMVERFKVAARALVRERKVYAEDVETMHGVLRLLESLTAQCQVRKDGQGVESALRELVEACEKEFCDRITERDEPDDSKVSTPEDRCHITFGHIRRARIALASPSAGAVVPEGWKLVPIEPTQGMVVEGFERAGDFTDSDEFEQMSGCRGAAETARVTWRAMLAAAPEVPQP